MDLLCYQPVHRHFPGFAAADEVLPSSPIEEHPDSIMFSKNPVMSATGVETQCSASPSGYEVEAKEEFMKVSGAHEVAVASGPGGYQSKRSLGRTSGSRRSEASAA